MGDVIKQEVKKTVLELLADEKNQLESGLKNKMIKFAQFHAAGDRTIQQACIDAGYSEISAHTRGTQLIKNINVSRLVQVYRELDALKNGIPLEVKRGWLVGVVTNSASRGAEITGATKLLAELDGNLQVGGGEGVTINVHMPHLAVFDGELPPLNVTAESSDKLLPDFAPSSGGDER